MSAGTNSPTLERPSPGRARTLRRSLAITFVAVSVLSVLLLGLLNYFQTRQLLTESVTNGLVNQQTAKALAIRNGLDRLEQTVVITAQTRDVVDAILEFSAAFRSLEGEQELLDPAESDRVDEFYGTVIDAIAAADLDSLSPEDLQPRSEAGRYLQYHYIVSNPFEPVQRSEMAIAAADDSEYGLVHTELHPGLVQLRSLLGFGDLLLVDTEGNVVYSTSKRLDYATNARSGPYRDTGMGDAITTQIAAAPVGDAVFVDFEIYLPAGGRPSLFVAAAVRDEARTVGALLVEVPIEALNNLTIEDGDWGDAGFGDTGEVYVVGRDHLMRTDSRQWLEDATEYQRQLEKGGFDPVLGDLMATFNSTVLLQPVATDAASDALDGEAFIGRTSNYLGRKSLTAAGPVGAEQVDWVVIAEIASAEAGGPLRDYVIRVLIAALILIPVVALVALFFADRVTKPVKPVVEAAADVAGGRLDTTLPDLGQNEFGDVARRLNLLTADLRAKEVALDEEEREIKRLLLSALPTRLVTELRSGDGELRDLVDTATVVAFSVTGMLHGAGIDDEATVELSAQFSSKLEAIGDCFGMERVRSATNQHVFVAGLDTPETAAGVAAEFAVEVVKAIEEFKQDTGVEMHYHAGISAGEVIAGLLNADQLTYGVFGDPPRTALALSGVAGPEQILVDEATAAEMAEGWDLKPARGLIDLRGVSVSAMVLTPQEGQVSGGVTSQ